MALFPNPRNGREREMNRITDHYEAQLRASRQRQQHFEAALYCEFEAEIKPFLALMNIPRDTPEPEELNTLRRGRSA